MRKPPTLSKLHFLGANRLCLLYGTTTTYKSRQMPSGEVSVLSISVYFAVQILYNFELVVHQGPGSWRQQLRT